jgi:hypothetical protein
MERNSGRYIMHLIDQHWDMLTRFRQTKDFPEARRLLAVWVDREFRSVR